MLPADDCGPYDVSGDPRLAQALVTPGEAASITAIARELRARIYSGEHPVGSRLPSRIALGSLKGVSAESVGTAMRMLAAEGLVSLEQGRGTYVLPRRRYEVEMSVRYAGDVIPEAVHDDAGGRLAEAAMSNPAVSGLELGGIAGIAPPVLLVSVTVETGGLAQAVTLALGLVRAALGHDEASRKAWDLDGASVRAEPEPGRG